ncbi:Thyroid receptor-interacting protein 11 [Thelohanellus kitauei]|uniref:Thyroid receptor-interacting protein 11 n=1 Tax=Thelohanellus kitauei TaxID=669202 RepID=A0A0C2MLX7_THEKT|nr:Thyroid receptor-interacting protein 11 [Thelohanellus kitauei]
MPDHKIETLATCKDETRNNSFVTSTTDDLNYNIATKAYLEYTNKLDLTESCPNVFKMYKSLLSADGTLDLMRDYLLINEKLMHREAHSSTSMSSNNDLYYVIFEMMRQINDVYQNLASYNYACHLWPKEFQIQKKHLSKLEEALNNTVSINQTLENNIKKSNLQLKNTIQDFELLKSQKMSFEMENTKLKSEVLALNTSLQSKEQELLKLTATYTALEKNVPKTIQDNSSDLDRLRQHLIETEESYVSQIKGLEDDKRNRESLVQSLSVELNRTKTNLSEARNKYEKHLKFLSDQLNHVSAERDGYMAQVVQLSNTSETNQRIIASLNESLNDCQKEFESQVGLLSDSYSESIKEIEHKATLKNSMELNELKFRIEDHHAEKIGFLDTKLKEIENIALKLQEKLHKHVSEVPSVVESRDGGTDKILLKNLIIAHSKLANEHKPLAWRVICDILDVRPHEIQPPTSNQSALSWIPIVNRFFSSETNTESRSPSLSQLFVEYLEEESKKMSVIDPYVPPISADELKDLVSRHQNRSL